MTTMTRITLPGLNQETSALGFGCASLGSRVSAAAGTRALAAAYDGGVRWFDVAPAYGAGEAEEILGAFLKGRRDHVQICTKVGLLAPKQSPAKKAVRSLLRPVVAAAKPLRAAIRKTGATSNTAVDLTPELLRSSLERSLTRLGTDHVDVYALHNARAEDLARDEIRETLEALLATGKARAIAVAGSAEVAASALQTGAPVCVLQFAQPAETGPGAGVLAAAPAAGLGCVTHSVFGVAGQLQAAVAALKADAALAGRVAGAGYDGAPEQAAAALLLDRARAANPAGVVLVSMLSDRSRAANLSAAGRAPSTAARRLCAEMGI